MNQEINSRHYLDDEGNPAGGLTDGTGFEIVWQNGPLVDPATGERREPSGAFVEGVILAALDRLKFYQGDGKYAATPMTALNSPQAGKFRCRENALAITKLEEALHWLAHRTADRERRGVEGTHQA